MAILDPYGRPYETEPEGVQFGPERQAFGPVRFEHQPAWVRSRGRKQKAGNKRAKSMLQRLKEEGRATVDDLAALAGFKTRKSPRKGKKGAASRKTSRRSRKGSSRRSSKRSSSRKAGNRRDYRKFLKARKTTFGPVRMSKQPRWVKEAYGKASKKGRKSKRRSARSTWSASRSGGKARRSARRYQARLATKMSGFQSMLSTRSSLGKRAAARLRRRLYRCGDNARLGSRAKIGRKKSRALRRELRRCKGRKIRASSAYAGITGRAGRSARSGRKSRKLSRSGSSRRLARTGSSGGQLSYAKLMKRLRGTKMKAWVCVGPKRTGCGGGKKGRRGSRVFGVLRA